MTTSSGATRAQQVVTYNDYHRESLQRLPTRAQQHEGGVASVHQAAQERYNLFVTPRASQIDNLIVKDWHSVDTEKMKSPTIEEISLSF